MDVLQNFFNSVGLNESENDNEMTKISRQNVLTWMCSYGYDVCKEYAIQRLKKWQQDESNVISSYLQVPLICTALKMGDPSDWEFVFEKYMTQTDPIIRKNLLSTLGCSENIIVLSR